MPLTSAQQVRQRVRDLPNLVDETRYGDGTASRFHLSYANITSASAYVPAGGTAWSATAASFDASGFVDFSGVISANSAFRLMYVWTVFSDDVIDHYLSGGILDATKQLAYDLQFDTLKRARWMAPDGSQYDDTQAKDALQKILASIHDEETEAADLSAGMVSWSVNQGE